MWLSSLQVRGLAGASERQLGRIDPLGPAPGPMVDGLRLLRAGLDRAQIAPVAHALGWSDAPPDPQIPDELALTHPWAAQACLDPGPRPQVTVQATFQLDPPLFGRLREAVVRDPGLVDGLADGTLTVRIGWRFTPDLRVVAVDRLGLAVGQSAVPLSDPAPWVGPLLTDLGARIAVVEPEPQAALAGRLADALLGPDPARRAGAQAVLAALAQAPFPDGPVQVVRADPPYLALGEALRPLRWGGPELLWHARIATAALLDPPDVLVIPRGVVAPVRDWLADRTQGPGATLEQVLLAEPADG